MRRATQYIAWCTALICLLSACGKAPAYQIEGELASLPDSTLYVVFENADGMSVDTLESREGKFKAERKEGDYSVITVYYDQQARWITTYPAKGKKTKITGDARYPELADIKGGRTNDEVTAFKESVKKLIREKYEIVNRLKSDDKSNPKEDNASSKLANIRLQLSEAAVRYIQQHPAEEASAVLIRMYLTDPDDTRKMDEMLAVLHADVKESPLVKELEAFSKKIKQTAPGQEALDFTVKDIYGKELSLSDFDRQYLLLSFAAPWCEKCKTDNGYLKEIRKRFPEKELGMLTVTLDSDQTEMRNTIKKDTIGWYLVSDSSGYASQLIDLYGVSAIPKNYLIDDTGKIILRSENGKEIQDTLAGLIGNDSAEPAAKK